MYRNRNWFGNQSDEWRITQQLGFKNTIDKYRIGHRIRAEQRLFKELSIYRFRYRFAVDFPLNGDRLDRNEAYLIAYSETLLSIANGLSPKGDLRFSIQIGWMLSELLKFQVGVEHRFDNIYLHTEQLSLLFTSLNVDLN